MEAVIKLFLIWVSFMFFNFINISLFIVIIFNNEKLNHFGFDNNES
jgi:hypothetical protein